MNRELLVNERMVQLMTIRDNVGENPGAGTSCDGFQSSTRDGVHFRRTRPGSGAHQTGEGSIRDTEMVTATKIGQKEEYRRGVFHSVDKDSPRSPCHLRIQLLVSKFPSVAN
jgi:hypothetical protein